MGNVGTRKINRLFYFFAFVIYAKPKKFFASFYDKERSSEN